MKVKELIEELKKLPQDINIYLSHDEEGNSFGTIEAQSLEENASYNGEHHFIIVFPYEEYLDYEDLK